MADGRGHLKVFIGMAPGVGKTYRMLQEGVAEADSGRDVVVGYLEPHGRAETVAQAEGLEIIPRRHVAYRGRPLEEMDLPAVLARKPELKEHMVQLQSGLGMKGGPENPIGARGMYLWQGNKDTLYRIHGTNEPGTIGHNVSSGCIRLTNDDVSDLYNRTPVGTKVVVLPTAGSHAASTQ